MSEMRPLRVVVHVEANRIAGGERQILLLAGELQARGHEVVVSCRPGSAIQKALEEMGVPTTGIRPRGDASPLSFLRFVRWLRAERPDVLLLTAWPRVFVASLAARWGGVPRVVFRLGGIYEPKPNALVRWKYRAGMRRVDALMVSSIEWKEHYRSLFPWFRDEDVHVVPNAISVPPAAPVPIRAEIGAPDDAVVMTAVGDLERPKGFDLLIDALAQLADPRLHLVIVGAGTQRDTLRAQAEVLGLADRVHLVGHRTDVPAILAASDVFVLSSRVDSVPNVLLEAMQAETLIVATAVPGTREALSERSGRPPAGWIVPVENVTALTEALADAVAAARVRSPEAEARRREARYRVEHWFAPARSVELAEHALVGWQTAGVS